MGGDVIREGQGHLLPTCSWTVGSGRCTRCLHFFVGVVFISHLHCQSRCNFLSYRSSRAGGRHLLWSSGGRHSWFHLSVLGSLSHSPLTSSCDITVVVLLTVWGAGLNAVGSLFVRLWVRCWISSCYVRHLTMEEGEAFTSTQAAHASSLLAFGMDSPI